MRSFLNSARYFTGRQINEALEYAHQRAYSARVRAVVVLWQGHVIAWINPAPRVKGTVVCEVDPFSTSA